MSFGVRRWIMGGKKPSILEKWWGESWGKGLNCLLVRDANSRAMIKPRTETVRAASFSKGGIDIMGVFKGVMLEVIRRPAIMLPQASRLIGFITVGLFSSIGERGLNRGWPIDTKKMTRRL